MATLTPERIGLATKRCYDCGRWLPTAKFNRNRRKPDGLATECKDCKRKQDARYYAANADQVKASVRANKLAQPEKYTQLNRDSYLRTTFGLTQAEYDAMLETQGGVCGMCGRSETAVNHLSGEVVALAVDHDHSCCPGKGSCGRCIRGLLCRGCNQKLGIYESVAASAAAYLERGSWQR